MRRILDTIIAHGAVPILATKADNVEGNHSLNLATARLADEYDLPLWNFWAAVQPLPNHGMDEKRADGFHISTEAWGTRSFSALQTLDSLWRGLRDATAASRRSAAHCHIWLPPWLRTCCLCLPMVHRWRPARTGSSSMYWLVSPEPGMNRAASICSIPMRKGRPTARPRIHPAVGFPRWKALAGQPGRFPLPHRRLIPDPADRPVLPAGWARRALASGWSHCPCHASG